MTDPRAHDEPADGAHAPAEGSSPAAARIDPATLRRVYAALPLVEGEMDPDPYAQFGRWFDDAVAAPELVMEPNAMVFSTADAQGRPSSRTVLLKGFDDRGFVLFTNYTSRKGREALANPHASLVFPWHHLDRQVVVVGGVERVSSEETAEYFDSRPRGSQLGAWTSHQSSVIGSRAELEDRRDALEARFGDEPIPVPDFWGGLRVVPETIEFWHGRADRLHDRLRYRRTEGAWVLERLSP